MWRERCAPTGKWLRPWTTAGRAPTLAHADSSAKLLVIRWLPGVLVEGDACEREPDTCRQAGALLASLHGQLSVIDGDYEVWARNKALTWLDRPHRITQEVEAKLRMEVATWPTPSATPVPTHGDCQPRNWLVHERIVSVIDLGRADLRPALTDFTRLAAQQFREDPPLEAALLDGYGEDPRESEPWRREQIREAVGTAVWLPRRRHGLRSRGAPHDRRGARFIWRGMTHSRNAARTAGSKASAMAV